MNSLEVANRIEKIAKEKGISGAELARRVDSDRSTINRYFKGTRKISMDEIPKFALALNVDPVELLIGKEYQPSNIIEYQPEFIKIPIVGTIACGDPITAEQNIEGFMYELEEDIPKGKLFGLIAKGNSMEPTISNGAKVLVREQSDVEHGEIAAVLINCDSEATLKRVKRQGDTVLLMADNPNHEPIIVDKNNPIRIIGKAIRVTKDIS